MNSDIWREIRTHFNVFLLKRRENTHVSKNMRGIHCFSKRMYFFKALRNITTLVLERHYSSKLMTTADTNFLLAVWQVIEFSTLYCLQMSLWDVPIPLLFLLTAIFINFLYFYFYSIWNIVSGNMQINFKTVNFRQIANVLT